MTPRLNAESIKDLRHRLSASRLFRGDGDGWEQGTPHEWLKSLLDDWRDFDDISLQNQLDAYEHLRVNVGDVGVHLVRGEGRGSDPLPLILSHGWPGSFYEFKAIIPLLTDPLAHGASSNDSFTVIIPSLPGFGFSDPLPPGQSTHGQIAELWSRIMTEALGYDHYVAHGSDLGAGITARLARSHPETVAGIHLATPGLALAPKPWSAREETFADALKSWNSEEGGYAHEHATKPLTLAAGLLDSPAGLAAWIGEKVRAWSSGDLKESATERDFLLATLTLYWTTGTIASSLFPYWAYVHATGDELVADEPIATPTAVTIFGGERVAFPKPPRELAERYFAVTSWNEHEVGGHFPSVSEPDLLARTIRDVFRPFRK